MKCSQNIIKSQRLKVKALFESQGELLTLLTEAKQGYLAKGCETCASD